MEINVEFDPELSQDFVRAAQLKDVCFGGAPSVEAAEKLDAVFPFMELHFQVRGPYIFKPQITIVGGGKVESIILLRHFM